MARDSQQRRLREMGKESALDYGQRLFSTCLDAVADDLNNQFESFVMDPYRSRQHAAAIPFFDSFSGTHHIAAVALTAAIDQLSKRQRFPTFLQHLGLAIERESRLLKLGRKSPMEFRRMVRHGMSRREISSKSTMRAMNCPVFDWNDQTRLQVGAFLADSIFGTELLRTTIMRKNGRQIRLVVPTEQAEQFIRDTKPRQYSASHLAMLVAPVDWPGMYGGGLLENELPLVKPVVQDACEKGALDHFTADSIENARTAVNHLQSVRLRCSGPMIRAQRISWEGGYRGLWPCSRNPLEIPARLEGNPSPEELKTRNRHAAAAHRDRECHRHKRVKIERGLQISEECADRVVFQAHYCDHRGRFYSNSAVSTQGPQHEKAIFDFAEAAPVNDEAFGWLLKAAAGHWGMSRSTWKERHDWGKTHIDQMVRAAEDPLGRLELWRSAKDPWLFLQCCNGIREAQATGRSGCPIRMDQTCSGSGILSALTREERVGRLTNLFGDTPNDLYSVVAEAVTAELARDLQSGDQKKQAMAQLWLKRGVDRGLCKPPILKTPYGGSYMSLCDGLVDELEKFLGYVPLEEYLHRVSIPSKYLASIMWKEMKEVISPVMEVKAWLRKCCKIVLTQGKPMEWTTPSGWPMRIADREPSVRRVHTMLFGKKVSMNVADQPMNAPLSFKQANKGISANAVHALDASFAATVINKAANKKIDLCATHDCFACRPADAQALHELLIWEFGQMYRRPILAEMRVEIEERTGISLPAPPVYNTMDPMAIGSNFYLFS